jgi:arsenate reductase (thioredoxin)
VKHVLFLCVGNSCRSQMAEAFARFYGADVLRASSAGLSPAPIVQPLTFEVMREKNVPLDGQHAKDLGSVGMADLDLLVNMSGVKLPNRIPIEVRDWKVEDPIGQPVEMYREVRDQIETLVMRLILELRRDSRLRPKPAGSRVLSRLSRRHR